MSFVNQPTTHNVRVQHREVPCEWATHWLEANVIRLGIAQLRAQRKEQFLRLRRLQPSRSSCRGSRGGGDRERSRLTSTAQCACARAAWRTSGAPAAPRGSSSAPGDNNISRHQHSHAIEIDRRASHCSRPAPYNGRHARKQHAKRKQARPTSVRSRNHVRQRPASRIATGNNERQEHSRSRSRQQART